MTDSNERIVVLVDMDCFFCQVEVKLQPNLKGKPLAVVQYNQWQSGGIIAVNYEARDHGVSRHMRAEEAKKKCPELVLATVPGVRGKPDTSRYRIAGREVVEVLMKHCNVIERASVDEAYLDITEVVDREITSSQPSLTEMIEGLPNTFVIGYSTVGNNEEAHRREAVENWINSAYGELGDIQSRRLAVAGTIVERIRADVYETTGYRCSAGVSYNKILAKLACGLHKPNRQTILPLAGVPSLYQTLPVKKVRNLGGKFGDVVIESLGCNVMADLLSYSLKDLQTRFDDKTGLWLYNIARGTDNEPVTNRLISKSIGSCKNFPGKLAIVSKETLEHWVKQLSLDMSGRLDQDLEENNRKATLLTISYHYYKDNKTINQSRSCRLASYKSETIMKNCLDIIIKFASKYPIAFMGMSASKFIEIDKGRTNFRNFFTTNSDATDVSEQLSASSANSTTNKPDASPNSENFVDATICTDANSAELELEEESSIPVDAGCSTSSDKTVNKILPDCTMDEKNAALISSKDIKSPMSLLRTENTKLKPDNFKKSFFMNILNANKKCEDDEGTSKNTEMDRIPGSSCRDSRIISTNGPEANNVSYKSINSTLQDQDGAKNVDEQSQVAFNSKSNIESGEIIRTASPTDDKQESNCAVNTRTEVIEEDDSNVIKLQDLFPDLNNIDESIVAALPPRLRREANLILENQRKKVVESKGSTVKSSQNKIKEQKRSRAKPAAQSRINKIDTFFNNEAKSVRNSEDSELFEKCPDCDKLIPLNEYLEHVDFHIARNLSKEINKSVACGPIATPEKDQTSNGKPIKRKRNKPETREPEKRSKSIASFFS